MSRLSRLPPKRSGSPWPGAPAGDPVARPGAAGGSDPAPVGRRRGELALEQNLDIQVERLNPQISDLSVAQARTAWTPVDQHDASRPPRTDAPVNSFLSGAEQSNKMTDRPVHHAVQLHPALRRGAARYSVAWDNSRSDDQQSVHQLQPARCSRTSSFQVHAAAAAQLQDRHARQQLLDHARRTGRSPTSSCSRRSSTTTRNVKNAYWDLAYAIASLARAAAVARPGAAVAPRQRARVSRSARWRPIDIVEAEAEVAQRRGGRDRRRGGHQAGGGPPARARSSTRRRPTSGTCGSSRPTPRRFRPAPSTSTPPCGTRSTTAPTSAGAQDARGQRRQHPLLPATRRCPTSTPG